jgi:hypothetical protein
MLLNYVLVDPKDAEAILRQLKETIELDYDANAASLRKTEEFTDVSEVVRKALNAVEKRYPALVVRLQLSYSIGVCQNYVEEHDVPVPTSTPAMSE